MSSSSLARASVDDYLESLPKIVQSQLYEAPATCLSIYRLLPPIAKFYVMSMLFYEKPVSLRDLDKWCKPTAIKYQLESLKRLKSLHLIEEDSTGMHVRLHSTFRKNFRDCLTGTQKSNAFGKVYTSVESDNISIQFLNSFASSKWENILHFMVGTELTITPSNSVLKLLTSGGLMDGKGPKNLKITNAGFQFLLQDLNSQIWTLLLQYLNLTQELNVDPVDVLNFIFILGSLELGKSYHTSSLTETQVTILVDLKEYGLAYQPSSTTERFYPTRLATTLTSDTAGPKSASAVVDQISHSSEDDDGFTSTPNQGLIILETNFKLYAYTNSPLEIAIINLFVNLKTRFANMVCGQINRESIRNALYNGITADQIIRFLESHAHPQLKILAKEKLDKKLEFDASNNINTAGGGSSNSNSTAQHRLEILPPTVVDQIKLWQLELDRIQTFDGYLFKDFSSNREYDVLFGYASEIGVLLWSDSSRKRFFVTKDGIEQVADFANRNLQRGKK